VKTKKPTGDAYCPPEIKRAHQIDDLINERAFTRDISDGELDGSDNIDNTRHLNNDEDPDNDSDAPPVKIKKADHVIHEAIIRRPDSSVPHRTSRMAGTDLMAKLSATFDPASQQARDADRANRSMQNAQLLALSQQLRDANTTTEGLRTQINDLQSRLHEAERARDRADLKLEMLQFSRSSSAHSSRSHRHSPSPPPVRRRHRNGRIGARDRSPTTKARLQRQNGKSKNVQYFPEGGSYTTWVTDPSSEDSTCSEKENLPPIASSSRMNHYSESYDRSSRRRLLNIGDADDDDSYSILPPTPFVAAEPQPLPSQDTSSNTKDSEETVISASTPGADKL